MSNDGNVAEFLNTLLDAKEIVSFDSKTFPTTITLLKTLTEKKRLNKYMYIIGA